MRELRWSPLVLVGLCTGCTTLWQAELHDLDERAALDRDAPFVKAHMRGGDLFLLEEWRLAVAEERLLGTGLHYDKDRQVIATGAFEIAFSDIQLVETNRPESVAMHNPQLVIMGVASAASATLSIICVVQPKLCWGSCPTLYARGADGSSLRAEGFSGSVARILEETDIDALGPVVSEEGRVELVVKNEALETHAIRTLELLAVPRRPGEQIVRAGNAFYRATPGRPPATCRATTGDCRELLAAHDERELFSTTRATDLAAREMIELSFESRPDAAGPQALLLTARNSLVNTFLFYQLLAYMGAEAGDWVMRLERGDPRAHELLADLRRALGDIEVRAPGPDGRWVTAGRFDEIGPIASDTHAVILPTSAQPGPVKVQLELTQGYWRIDEAVLVDLNERLTPTLLRPEAVRSGGADSPAALARLGSPDQYLITYPGDVYAVYYRLPPAMPNPALFVAARGYYIEWIREKWLAEEDPIALARLMLDPGGFLRRMAPVFKRLEPHAEAAFWQSRIAAGGLQPKGEAQP